jgi:putative FmdB family regulatory protein
MPTYSYECQACGTKFEQYQKFTDAPITKCPQCKKNKVRRVLSAAAIVFKGSGWYKTDSRSKSPTSPKNAVKTAEKSAESSTESSGSASKSDTSTSSNGDSAPAKAKPEKSAPKSES